MTKTPFTTINRFGFFVFGSLLWTWPLAGQLHTPMASSNSSNVTSHDQQEQSKTDAIRKRVRAGDLSAVDEAAVQLDRTAATALLSDLIMSQARDDESLRQTAGRALSKMQAEKDFSDLIIHSTQLTSNSSNKKYQEGIEDRNRAFQALRYMHSTRSIIVLAAFLFDQSPPPAEWSADVVEASNSVLAAAALASFGFTDAPTTETASFYPNGVEMWKKWWVDHKARFEYEQSR